MTVDTSRVFPLHELKGEDADETSELGHLVVKAQDFLNSFDWCAGVRDIRVGLAVPAVVGVFLAHIIPRIANVDEVLWVVVGDIPSAYLVTDEASTPTEALLVYAGLMLQWVTAVRTGAPLTELVPVDAHPTPTAASMLSSRIEFLVDRVVPDFEAHPRPC